MSRVANNPVEIPKGVEVNLGATEISVKGGNGSLSMPLHSGVEVKQEDNVLTFAARDGSKNALAMSGTTRALVNNMVVGVSAGFDKKLELNGVGYRAKASGSTINLTLGSSGLQIAGRCVG
jgi:large subunit ribosomal protein L6